MFIFVLKKMLKNKWMVLCLLLGSVFAVAMVSSIPIYTSGILQRLLIKDLENYQKYSGSFPGYYQITGTFNYMYEPDARAAVYVKYDKKLKELAGEIQFPILSAAQKLKLMSLDFIPAVQKEEDPKAQYMALTAMSGMRDHIEILHGRIFSGQKKDGVIDAIATEGAMKELRLILGDIYTVNLPGNAGNFRIRVAGVFGMKDLQDTYWYEGLGGYDRTLFMDFSLFNEEYIKAQSPYFESACWNYAFDYHAFNIGNLNKLVDTIDTQKKWFQKYGAVLTFNFNCLDILNNYDERRKQETTTLWVLIIPILLVLSFYIFMVSQLIIKNEQNEIAVLKSRGANKRQIFAAYLIESLILGGIAFLTGPPLGLLLCRIVGAANGFLEFVSRTSLPLSLKSDAYVYSFCALVFLVITMMIPAYLSSRTTIVLHKQSKARSQGSPVWKKYFIDILILGLAVYGLYQYGKQQKLLSLTGIRGTDISIDPLLFLISTFFVLGAGLVFLRIFPYIMELIFRIGRKIWNPVLYTTFIQVGRSRGQEQFLMLFIMFALSIGLFNANAARTINRNMEDKAGYAIGADITIQPYWNRMQLTSGGTPVSAAPSMPGDSGVPGGAGGTADQSGHVVYIEPPFGSFAGLSGIETATKVFRTDEASVQAGDKWIDKTSVMGIIPNEFGKVAWYRSGLLAHHLNEYLNLIVDAPKAVLVSKNFRDDYGVNIGDSLNLKWGGQNFVDVTVYAFVDYWPSFNPYPEAGGISKKGNCLVVGNMSYLFNRTAIQPYAIWAKKKPGAADRQIYDDIEKKELIIDNIESVNQMIIRKKNDPLLQGINGALTLGFVMIMVICLIGFLIYWILSIRMRILQFGIFRAVGLSMKKVIGMIISEQVMLSGTAIFMGIILGGATSSLFVPLLQLVYGAAEQVPPFRVVAYGGDYIKIYAVIALMLIIGFAVLTAIISRIRIDQALKLGED